MTLYPGEGQTLRVHFPTYLVLMSHEHGLTRKRA